MWGREHSFRVPDLWVLLLWFSRVSWSHRPLFSWDHAFPLHGDHLGGLRVHLIRISWTSLQISSSRSVRGWRMVVVSPTTHSMSMDLIISQTDPAEPDQNTSFLLLGHLASPRCILLFLCYFFFEFSSASFTALLCFRLLWSPGTIPCTRSRDLATDFCKEPLWFLSQYSLNLIAIFDHSFPVS